MTAFAAGLLPVHHAIMLGDGDLTSLLLSRNTSVSQNFPHTPWSLLHFACGALPLDPSSGTEEYVTDAAAQWKPSIVVVEELLKVWDCAFLDDACQPLPL